MTSFEERHYTSPSASEDYDIEHFLENWAKSKTNCNIYDIT
jgi:hypothetical protein